MPISDTSPEAEAVQLEIYRRMSPARKIEIVEDANRTARLLALTGLRSRYPDAPDDELNLRLFHLVLGTELATRVYGPLPDTDSDDLPGGPADREQGPADREP